MTFPLYGSLPSVRPVPSPINLELKVIETSYSMEIYQGTRYPRRRVVRMGRCASPLSLAGDLRCPPRRQRYSIGGLLWTLMIQTLRGRPRGLLSWPLVFWLHTHRALYFGIERRRSESAYKGRLEFRMGEGLSLATEQSNITQVGAVRTLWRLRQKKISHRHWGPLRGSSSPFLALGAGEG